MKKLLAKLLRGIDLQVARLADLSLRVFVAPLLIAITLAASVWMYRHDDVLSKLFANKLTKEQRTEGLYAAGMAVVALLIVYGVAIAVQRLRRVAWPPLRTTAWLNRVLFFICAGPFVLALEVPRIETKYTQLTLLFTAIASLCIMVSVTALAERVRPWFDGAFDALDQEDARWKRLLCRYGCYLVPLLLIAMWVIYSVHFSKLAINSHHAFRTRTIDLGYYDNIFYQSLHGRPLACTFLKAGHHGSAHFDPILVVLSPLYLIYPRAEGILALQAVWCGAGVFPAYLIGKRVLDSRAAGFVLAITYALYPALHGANLYEFHSLTLVAMPMLWVLYFLEAGHVKRYWVMFLVALLVREDIPLLMCFVGAYAILSKRPGYARIGWVTIVISVAYFIVVKKFFMTSSDVLNAGKESYGFGYYYRGMIPNKTGISGLVTSLVTNPIFVVKHALTEAKLTYLAKLFLPVALLPFFAKRARVMLVYGFLFLLLASRKHVFTTHFQYSMLIFPVLLAITPLGLKRLRDGRLPGLLGVSPRALAAGLLSFMVVSTALNSWKFGAIVENGAFRGGFTRAVFELDDKQRASYAKFSELAAIIEPGASVTVTNKTGPHLSNRKEVYLYRQNKPTQYVFIEEKSLKGKRKRYHQRRVKRGELIQLGAHATFKLFRLQPDKSKWKKLPAKKKDAKKPKKPKKPKKSKKSKKSGKKRGATKDAAPKELQDDRPMPEDPGPPEE